jgi:archaellum component FlaG (FlaF/FlaG flagellin family)
MATDMISTAIIGIATLIIVFTLVATLFPQVFEIAGSISSTTHFASERIDTSAIVINYDIPATNQLQFDVLNNGKSGIGSSLINKTVAYLYNHSMPGYLLTQEVNPSAQYWEYTVTGNGDDEWAPGEVLELRVISPAYSFEPGDYKFKLLLYNGAVVQYGFTI